MLSLVMQDVYAPTLQQYLSCFSLGILHNTAEQKPHFAGTTISLHVW